MTRTNIDVDDRAVAEVMRRYGLTSKRAAVDYALKTLAGEPMTPAEAVALYGSGWDGDLDAMREGRVP